MQPYHEFFDQNGLPRPHQEPLSRYLGQHDAKAVQKLHLAVQGRLLEQEVSYNILSSPDGASRNWVLDEVPHVIAPEEFSPLSAALAERAHLLEACLEDFYGPQRLIRDGIVPADVVLGNPHFFRSLHGVRPLGGRRLVLYAADVVKTPNGQYVVHSDRTAAPTGSGYALENRLAIGQILAEPFREYRIRKVNRFFDLLAESVRGLSARSIVDPRIVLLTPGVHDESSFEHGYLARYQGFELVEGRDLTVRGQEVFLKTLEGLKRVDVILRRISDDWCDPLELRADSLLGVSGLVEASRAGTVGMANPLGSGLVESPAFRAYLPKISLALFGRPLALPSIPTRHLANADQRQEVFDTFADWIIRPAYGDRQAAPLRVGSMVPSDQEKLRAEVLESPGSFVAEKWPEASRVPIGLNMAEEGSLSLRLFACASGEEFTVMPGALGRVNDSPDGLFLEGETATISKDVWVIGNDDAGAPELPRMPEPLVEIRRGGVDLPSRLFDDIYWLGRYTQRCNCNARIIRAGLEPIQTEGSEVPVELVAALPRTLAALQVLSPGTIKKVGLEQCLFMSIYDRGRGNSISSALSRVHILTTATRSRLSNDTWGILRRATDLYAKAPAERVSSQEAADRLDDLLLSLAAFHGITSSNMVRGHAWVFLEMGRRIEQGVFVLTLLTHLFQSGRSRVLMETLLRVCDSLLTYRSRYLSNLQPTPVVDLVLTDDSNPQSVIFQVKRMLACVRSLPQKTPFPLSRAEQRLVTLETALLTADLGKACRGEARALKEIAEEGINLLWQVSDDLTQTYFIHASRSRAIAPSHWIGAGLEADT